MDFSHFSGPMGGSLAAAWGFGAACGYGFAVKTMLKAANDRINELKVDLSHANDRIQALEDQRFDIAREGK